MFKSDINIIVILYLIQSMAQHIIMEDIKTVCLNHPWTCRSFGRQINYSHNDAKITMVEVASWLAKNGHSRSHSLNFGGIYEFSEKTSVKYVQAVHSSSMPDGSYGGHQVLYPENR